jgi:drug/metabolite transporter (DMT)-like permease
MSNEKSRISAIVKALFVVFLWATSWVLIKIGLQDIPALTFAGLRYTLAFICLIPIVIFNQGMKSAFNLSRRDWIRLLLLGLLLYSITQGASFLAISLLPAVTVNMLWSFSSITVAVLGIFLLAERPTGFQWLGTVLATLGALAYFFPVAIQGSLALGILVSLIGILANAGAVILGRDINRAAKIPPLIVTFISMGIGSIALLTTGVLAQGLPILSLQSWVIIGWLAIVNTAFAFTIWNQTLRTLTAMESSIINGTMLMWVPILAVLFLGESITAKELLGLIMAGAGTLIVQLRDPSKVSSLFRRKAP